MNKSILRTPNIFFILFFPDVSIEAFEKSKKNLPLMPLQSLKNFTILYCGTRPNTIVPRQSRSVSPIKDNAADKPKYIPTGALRRTGSPTRMHHRSSVHSTPLYTVNDKKLDSGNKETQANAPSSSAKSVMNSASVKKSKAESKAGNSGYVTAKTESNLKKDDSQVEKSEDDSNKLDELGAEKKGAETENQVKTEPKSHVVVVDTLTKTNDSLTEATNVLGRLSQSLNQAGLAESILEEVRLKMTHADLSASSISTSDKPNSAKVKRENLERGN